MKKLLTACVLGLMVVLAGCSEMVEPGTKAKVLTGSGYNEETLEPGRAYGIMPWHRMIVLETGVNINSVNYEAFLADKLKLSGTIAVRSSIRTTDNAITLAMFNAIKLADRENTITHQRVWNMYARDVILNEVRTVMSTLTWEEISSNYEMVGQNISDRVSMRLENTPIAVGAVNLGTITPPDAITKKYEEIEKQVMQSAKEEADHAVAILKEDNANKLATAQRTRMEYEANTIAKYNATVNASLSPMLLQQQYIKAMSALGKDSTVYVVPSTMTDNTGLNQRVFAK